MLTGTIVCLPTRTIRPLTLAFRLPEMTAELRRRRPIRHLQLIGLRGDGAVGARRPGEHFARQLILDRRGDVRREALVDPAGVAEVPRLEMAVGEAPRLHLLDRPFAGGLQARRSGDARPVDVGQHVQRLHDLRVAVLFLADLGVDVGVEAATGRASGANRARTRASGGKRSEHGADVNFRPPAAYIEGNDDTNDGPDGDAAGRGAGRRRARPGPGRTGRDPAGRGAPRRRLRRRRRAQRARHERAAAGNLRAVPAVGRPGAAARPVAADQARLSGPVSDAGELSVAASRGRAQPGVLSRRRSEAGSSTPTRGRGSPTRSRTSSSASRS